MADLGTIATDTGTGCVSIPPKGVSGQAFHAANPNGPFRYQIVLYRRSTMQFVSRGGIRFDGSFAIPTIMDIEDELHLVAAYNLVSGQTNAVVYDSITPVLT